jgi:thiol:disulfide interchange protein DsbD
MSRLPRAGYWMVWIKRAFAIVMVAAAQYYLVQMGKLLI